MWKSIFFGAAGADNFLSALFRVDFFKKSEISFDFLGSPKIIKTPPPSLDLIWYKGGGVLQ